MLQLLRAYLLAFVRGVMLGLGSYESSSEDESTKDTTVGVKGALAVDQKKPRDSVLEAKTLSKEPVEDTQNEATG